MARTKQTPRNPNIDRPVAAVVYNLLKEGLPLDLHKEKSQAREASS